MISKFHGVVKLLKEHTHVPKKFIKVSTDVPNPTFVITTGGTELESRNVFINRE